MSRSWVTLLALLLLTVPLLGEAACDDCAGEQLGTFCATCVLCLCCGHSWATRPASVTSFQLRSCGIAVGNPLDRLLPPPPRKILHIPLAAFA